MKRTATLAAFTISFFLALTSLAGAAAKTKQVPQQAPPKLPPQKVVRAVRTTEPITIDGRLDEKVWQGPAAEGFTQSDPKDGEPSSERTKVWVAYDDHALYVAAFCYDSAPAKIIGRLGRRDAKTDSDSFGVALDPYWDKRSGYFFSVTAAGSMYDSVLSNDVGEDESWDGVWEARAHVDGQGWTVEMKIPFNQIRFPKKDEYVWGVNFLRTIKRKNEKAAFAWVPKSDSAFVSRFARLEGIQGISPGRQVEFMPYAVASAQLQPAEPGNPYETGHRTLGNAGFDLKVGLKSNLTLDATVNPDFGQVEVDPAVINLSAYETYYAEKRPFFIEGASLFRQFGRGGVYLNANINWPQPTFFYSRRIGREPEGYVTEDGYARVPDRTTILGATKITGKLGGSWNVGFISALTARESAAIDQSGTILHQDVEPFTYYGALRVQKEIGEGKSGIGMLATGVMRDIRTGSTSSGVLSDILNKNAFSLAADGWAFLDKKRDWVVGGWAGGTRVEGTAEDITRLQESSMHYYQRPDATHVSLNPWATSLSGWGGRFNLGKQNGNFLFLASAGALSPGFDPNDVGFQYGMSDIIQAQVLPGYQWTKPGKIFQYFMIIGGYSRNYDFGGNKTWDVGLLSLQGTFRNFWQFNVMFAYNPQSVSNDRTRGGPLSLTPWGYEVDTQLSTDTRRPIVAEWQSMFYRQSMWGDQFNATLAVRWKPRSNINLSVGPMIALQGNAVQWVTQVADAAMTATYGNRYVFAHIDEKVVGSEIRVDWTFTPRLTLQAYIQPYIAVGRYDAFKELARPKSLAYDVFGQGASTIGYADGVYTVDPDGAGPAAPFTFSNPDFNYKSLRGTVVFRWEYMPGSLIYFVWTQNRADYANPGSLRLGRDLGSLFSAPGDNIFLLKVSYRWNM
ncbi:MAG TPA: DUF5916 domain-containing protein [Terriglobales bacterium]|nr:DUF5916 domain-containing protein [Terriglobales bacterium]